MPDEIAAAGRTVIDMLAACSAAPDDADVGRAADDALRTLERLLTDMKDMKNGKDLT